MNNESITIVIASEAWRSRCRRDCFIAIAPRNNERAMTRGQQVNMVFAFEILDLFSH